MIEDALMQYGAMGIFVAYLIFDRQTVIKSLQKTIAKNTEVLHALVEATGRRR